MATNVKIFKRKNETEENLVRRFIKKCKKERVVEEARERKEYLKPSVKKRRKRERAQRQRERDARKAAKQLEKFKTRKRNKSK